MDIGSRQWKETIVDGALEMGIRIEPSAVDSFAIHARELVRWTRKTNLTAITDPLDVAVKHFLDSVAVTPFMPPEGRILDVGSGGGFPGIPLKVTLPSLTALLIDGVRKKVSFLQHIMRILTLSRIDAKHIRAEDLKYDETLSDGFDVIVCRAVSGLQAYIRNALPLLATGGKIIAMRAETGDEELKVIRSLISEASSHSDRPGGPTSISVHRYRLPYLTLERSLVIVD